MRKPVPGYHNISRIPAKACSVPGCFASMPEGLAFLEWGGGGWGGGGGGGGGSVLAEVSLGLLSSRACELASY